MVLHPDPDDLIVNVLHKLDMMEVEIEAMGLAVKRSHAEHDVLLRSFADMLSHVLTNLDLAGSLLNSGLHEDAASLVAHVRTSLRDFIATVPVPGEVQ